MHGFHIWPLMAKLGMSTWKEEYLPLVRDGIVKQRAHSRDGFETLARALDDVLRGQNLGKTIVVIADE